MKKLVSLLVLLAAMLSFCAMASAACAHSITYVGYTEPTCSKVGYRPHYKCTKCGARFTDAKGTTKASSVSIAKTNHSYGSTYKHNAQKHWMECRYCGYKTKEAAHTYKNFYCECGAKDPHVHTTVYVPAVEATCETAGVLEHYECECGTCFRDEAASVRVTATAFEVPALGHALSQVEGGYECANCGRTFADAAATQEIVIEKSASIGDLVSALTTAIPSVKAEDLLGSLSDLEAPITRELTAQVLYRLASLKGEVATPTDLAIADIDAMSEDSVEAAAWAVSAGMMNLDENGAFNPAANLTAADIIEIVTRVAGLIK